MTAQGKQVKHAEEILRLLEAVRQPEKLAIMHCRGHQKGNTDSEIGNRLSDYEARRVAESGEKVLSLVPDGRIHTVSTNQKPIYSKEDLKLIKDLKGKMEENGWVHIADGQVIIPSYLLWPTVLIEHNKTHWGSDALYKSLN